MYDEANITRTSGWGFSRSHVKMALREELKFQAVGGTELETSFVRFFISASHSIS
jgi:hypothetical protein